MELDGESETMVINRLISFTYTLTCPVGSGQSVSQRCSTGMGTQWSMHVMALCSLELCCGLELQVECTAAQQCLAGRPGRPVQFVVCLRVRLRLRAAVALHCLGTSPVSLVYARSRPDASPEVVHKLDLKQKSGGRGSA